MTLDEAMGSLRTAQLNLDRSPGDIRCQRDLSKALQRVAGARLRIGEFESALQAYLEALRIERALANSEPDSFDRQTELLLVLQSVGDVRSQQGRHSEALRDYLEAWNISRQLRERDHNREMDELELLQKNLQDRINATRLQTVAAGRL